MSWNFTCSGHIGEGSDATEEAILADCRTFAAELKERYGDGVSSAGWSGSTSGSADLLAPPAPEPEAPAEPAGETPAAGDTTNAEQ